MSDNNEENKVVDELKKETTETVKQFKDTLKTVNIKEDTERTKGFILDLIKNPIHSIKNIAENPTPYATSAIILFVIWTVASMLNSIYISSTLFNLNSLLSNAFSVFIQAIRGGLAPALSIAILSGIIFIKDKNKSHSLINIITLLIITNIPSVFASVVSILNPLSSSIRIITNPISSFCYIITILLTYFGIKFLSKEEDDNAFIKHFAIIYGIYVIFKIFFSFFGIYI